MLLSGKAITQAVQQGELSIVPFLPESIKSASYIFTLAPKLLIPHKVAVVSVETGVTSDELSMDSESFVLRPGEFVVGFTQEALSLHGTFGCMLSTRGSCAQIGLNILLSSTFAEPDTHGPLAIEIHNVSASPILITPGMKIVKGVFFRVE